MCEHRVGQYLYVHRVGQYLVCILGGSVCVCSVYNGLASICVYIGLAITVYIHRIDKYMYGCDRPCLYTCVCVFCLCAQVNAGDRADILHTNLHWHTH